MRELAAEAASCTRCDLYRHASRTVFGEGRARASLVLVGEQPGDQEDQQGHPFVGPAGRLLDRALRDSGVAREDAYITNAVKHFKWQPRGKRRIHQRPSGSEIRACRHWLEAELTAIRPRVLVAMGATAGVSLFGSRFRVGEHRGQVEELTAGSWQGLVVSTIHPSAVLRAPDEDARHDAYAGFVSDLAIAGRAAARAA
ncbi:MAG: UdgX family uracil-DNA binding protein [Actinobacteria bacterium]|nr:UdgX family uracil-DNA binding protein [Actinomycetota bacterium]MBO0817511.1 UdgX family uracil-DNA binding protein [Actinomycetota bacterium]